MTKTQTQLEAARADVVTPEMRRVAERECVTPESSAPRSRAAGW
jgi:thiamine biosynthesis protein ThiC